MLAERYTDAETAFDIALSNIDSSEVAAPLIYAAAAQFNVQRDRLNLAIPLLKMALETVSDKENRIRYAFVAAQRSEEHTSELQSLMRISYAVFCLKKKKQITNK